MGCGDPQTSVNRRCIHWPALGDVHPLWAELQYVSIIYASQKGVSELTLIHDCSLPNSLLPRQSLPLLRFSEYVRYVPLMSLSHLGFAFSSLRFCQFLRRLPGLFIHTIKFFRSPRPSPRIGKFLSRSRTLCHLLSELVKLRLKIVDPALEIINVLAIPVAG